MIGKFRSVRWLLASSAVALCILVASEPAHAQIITSIAPSTVSAGGPAFTLTVNGTGFSAGMVARVNGVNRPTVFVSPVRLTATILSTDIGSPGKDAITVSSVNGTAGSNTFILSVITAGPPVLTSAGVGIASPGAVGVRLTLTGSNFSPGAKVVISPPLPDVAQSTASIPADDVSVDSVTVLNPSLMVAVVSVSRIATPGLRAIDVVNADGTSSGNQGGSASSKPLRIAPKNSLGAPLSVTTIAFTSPRDGTLVMQGDALYGEATLAGAGSGTVIGAWLWDGNVVEQFTAVFAGGQSVRLRSNHSFPTSFLGVHTVQVRIQQPNNLVTRPVTVVVNPGDWEKEKLLKPVYGARIGGEAPSFLWAPVPGAAKYQIGFSARPYFSTVRVWYDVIENQWAAPADVWDSIPEGEVYWTVRAVEISGEVRKPLPMRLLLRFPSNTLTSASQLPGVTPQGNPQLEWLGLKGHYLYRITISEDSEGSQIVRRYLTANSKVDLRALKGKLDPAKTYYWRVDAVAPDGRTILVGPTNSFGALALQPHSRRFIAPGSGEMVLASLHARDSPRGISLALMAMAEIKIIADRIPAPDSTVTDSKPPVIVQFTTAPNAFDMALTVDGTDVTSLIQLDGTKLSYTPPVALANGEHTVNLSLGQDSATWKFTVQAPSGAAANSPSTSDAEAATASTASSGEQGSQPTAAAGASEANPNPKLQMQTQIGTDTQWASGSTADTNAATFGQQMTYQQGPWTVQVNGSGLLHTTLNPEFERASLGHVGDYVTEAAMQRTNWGMNLRFGIIAPVLYADSQFVTPATARQGLETILKTSAAGNFGFYINTDDRAPGGGFGFEFRQQMMGASWEMPLPKKYAELRLMWLSAHDTGGPDTGFSDFYGDSGGFSGTTATAGGGDLYGGVLLIHLPAQWQWTSEYAWGYNAQNFASDAHHLFGRAWRSDITGSIKSASLSFGYSDVGTNFNSPANPGILSMSIPGRRGVTASLMLPSKIGTFTLGDQFLQSGIKDANAPEENMQTITEGWSKNLDPKTVVSLTAHQTLTGTSDVPATLIGLTTEELNSLKADQRDVGADLSVTRQVGKVSLSLSGERDWLHNSLLPTESTITSSILAGANWNYATFFRLNANMGFNWVAADKITVGGTHGLSAYLQPTFIWQRRGLQAGPLATYNQTRTELFSGFLTSHTTVGQYGGRVSWTMPGEFKFSALSLEGDLNRRRNLVVGTTFNDKTLLLVWTITWGHQLAL